MSEDLNNKFKKNLDAELVFSGSDISGFKKSSDNEAENVISNTSIKIAMKLPEG